jgi:hypothetical protein
MRRALVVGRLSKLLLQCLIGGRCMREQFELVQLYEPILSWWCMFRFYPH